MAFNDITGGPKLVPAYDTQTGRKLPDRVPEHFFDLFPHIKPTPRGRAAAQEQSGPTTTKARKATDSKE